MIIARSTSRSKLGGSSLIEILIGLVLGLIVIAAASAIYVSTVQSTRASEVESKLNENATITLGILQQQVRLAGYSSIFGSSTYSIRQNFKDSGVKGCSGGFSGTLTVPFASIACTNVDGSTSLPDSFVVRYEANAFNTIPTSTSSPTNCIGNAISASTVSAATSTLPSAPVPPQFALAENRYFIRTSGTPSGGPELYCLGLTGPAAYSTPQPLMEGVEYIKLSYGVANTPTGAVTAAYMSGAEIDTTFATEPNRWDRVVSVKICIIMRNTDSVSTGSSFSDTNTNKYYDCNNLQQTSVDRLLRRSYTTTVMLKNKISFL